MLFSRKQLIPEQVSSHIWPNCPQKQVVSGIHNFYFLYTKITWPLGWKMDLKHTKTLFSPLPFGVSQNLKLSGVELCFLCANNSWSVSAFDFLHLLCCLWVCCCVSETCSTCVADVWRKQCLRLKTQDRKGDPTELRRWDFLGKKGTLATTSHLKSGNFVTLNDWSHTLNGSIPVYLQICVP